MFVFFLFCYQYYKNLTVVQKQKKIHYKLCTIVIIVAYTRSTTISVAIKYVKYQMVRMYVHSGLKSCRELLKRTMSDR